MEDNLLIAFALCFGAGVLLAIYVWWRGWLVRRSLQAEIQRLKNHLQSHMELSHEGTAHRKAEVERLKEENENLRVTLKAWQQKPDRRELRTLHLYDHAARQLMKSAPGFASHWQTALEEAEEVIAQEDKGFLAFARRLILPPTRGASSGRDRDDEGS
jgi:hypothetical protein